MSNRQYYGGKYPPFDPYIRKRCKEIRLKGYNRTTLIREINPLIVLIPEYIECCFGSEDIKVVVMNARMIVDTIDLQAWLDREGEYLDKLVGFLGAEGTYLYLVLIKDVIL